jgi:hypothetical protein
MRTICALSAIGDKGSSVFTRHSITNIFRRESLSAYFCSHISRLYSLLNSHLITMRYCKHSAFFSTSTAMLQRNDNTCPLSFLATSTAMLQRNDNCPLSFLATSTTMLQRNDNCPLSFLATSTAMLQRNDNTWRKQLCCIIYFICAYSIQGCSDSV